MIVLSGVKLLIILLQQINYVCQGEDILFNVPVCFSLNIFFHQISFKCQHI